MLVYRPHFCNEKEKYSPIGRYREAFIVQNAQHAIVLVGFVGENCIPLLDIAL